MGSSGNPPTLYHFASGKGKKFLSIRSFVPKERCHSAFPSLEKDLKFKKNRTYPDSTVAFNSKRNPNAMWTIPILIGSVRRGRQSPTAARFIKTCMEATGKIRSPFLDLLEIALPVMEERLSERDDPPPGLADLSRAIASSDALVIVTPEYNNGIPGSLKNALDYLYDEFSHKPVGVVTISGGPYGGVNCLAQLRPVLLTMGAYPIAEKLPIAKIDEALSEEGIPRGPSLQNRAKAFIDELLWVTERFASVRKT